MIGTSYRVVNSWEDAVKVLSKNGAAYAANINRLEQNQIKLVKQLNKKNRAMAIWMIGAAGLILWNAMDIVNLQNRLDECESFSNTTFFSTSRGRKPKRHAEPLSQRSIIGSPVSL